MARGVLALLLASGTGCAEEADLVVATPWTPSGSEEFEARLDASLAARNLEGGGPSIRWVRLPSWESPHRVLERAGRVDALIGWPASVCRSLQADGLLPPGDATLRVVAPGGPSPTHPPDPSERRLSLVDGDPRVGPRRPAEPIPDDPAVLAWTAGSGAGLEPAFAEVLDGAPATMTPIAGDASRRVDRIAAAMIGAVFIDGGLGDREPRLWPEGRPFEALEQRPPWPPESIAALRSVDGGEALLGTLAGAITADPEARDWLRSQWDRPRRPIDRALIEQMAAIGGGLLVDDPRFMALLRSDWTDWARLRAARGPRPAPADAP